MFKSIKKTIFPILFFSLLFPSNINSEERCRKFPLELKKYEYKVTFGKEDEDTKEIISTIFPKIGAVTVDIEKDCGNYRVGMDASSSEFLKFIGYFRKKMDCRFSFEANSKDANYSLQECSDDFQKKVLFFEEEFKKRTYSFRKNSSGLELKLDNEIFNVPDDTFDPITICLNLLTKEYPSSGKYSVGRLKRKDKHPPVEIIAEIKKTEDNYLAKFTFPKLTILNEEAPFEIKYSKKGCIVDIEQISLFIEEKINSWAVANPKKED